MAGKWDNRKLIGPIFAAMGTLFAAIGVYFMMDAFDFAGKARKATAEVLSVETQYDTDSEGRRTVSYLPTLRYISIDDQTYEAQTHISSSEYNYAIGRRVEVLYDPAEPGEVRINSFWSLWMLPIVFTLGGLLFAVIGIVISINTYRGHVQPDGTIRRDRDLS